MGKDPKIVEFIQSHFTTHLFELNLPDIYKLIMISTKVTQKNEIISLIDKLRQHVSNGIDENFKLFMDKNYFDEGMKSQIFSDLSTIEQPVTDGENQQLGTDGVDQQLGTDGVDDVRPFNEDDDDEKSKTGGKYRKRSRRVNRRRKESIRRKQSRRSKQSRRRNKKRRMSHSRK